MPTCPICGAPLSAPAASCDYAVPLERAPGIGDPGSIDTGKMSQQDHELSIARWRVHHPGEPGASPTVMAWARERLARAGHLVPEG